MIENKVVVITGASSGIGAATATLLAERGAKVVLGARRKDRLDALAERLGAVALPTDVRRPADVAALVRLARETHGRLDVLVGNAGIGPISPLDSLRVDDWDAMIDVNVKGVLHGIAAALPVFREQGHGQFVHTASTAAYRTVPAMAVYAATKTAVRTISEGLRQEAGPDLRVTLVSPGMIATGFIDGIPEAAVRERLGETRDAVAIPPAAIARAIAFAIDQPAEVDVNEIVVRPTAQD
ncbi:SDR family oxidoreductase [Amycolatopsis tolypomycina]|uniref:NADP-dependent 3-hydroxy acid dehydrogenase YdfG n=1 Tax=Amycolatopsis tolypomycina TaxID=208445 RepID=A0A1H5AV11_9PSEU|nr:SDR family oxidoreductase [Amycolatopsis tolypomycina]SED46077.1 NADP-dependent 3-hydroxy acid dehydrogenase YdfG [Amycolatopsis tolypomycina]